RSLPFGLRSSNVALLRSPTNSCTAVSSTESKGREPSRGRICLASWLEMSAIRGFFQFMEDMNAPDVLFNPARGVKVKGVESGGQKSRLTQPLPQRLPDFPSK